MREDGSLGRGLREKQCIGMSRIWGAATMGVQRLLCEGLGRHQGHLALRRAPGSCSSREGCPAAAEPEGQGLAPRLRGVDHPGRQVVGVPGRRAAGRRREPGLLACHQAPGRHHPGPGAGMCQPGTQNRRFASLRHEAKMGQGWRGQERSVWPVGSLGEGNLLPAHPTSVCPRAFIFFSSSLSLPLCPPFAPCLVFLHLHHPSIPSPPCLRASRSASPQTSPSPSCPVCPLDACSFSCPIPSPALSQDTLGGRFDATQAFVGELAQFGVWDHMLAPAEILGLANCTSHLQGNVIQWDDQAVEVFGGASKGGFAACEEGRKA